MNCTLCKGKLKKGTVNHIVDLIVVNTQSLLPQEENLIYILP